MVDFIRFSIEEGQNLCLANVAIERNVIKYVRLQGFGFF